jgi:hypothetical protein
VSGESLLYRKKLRRLLILRNPGSIIARETDACPPCRSNRFWETTGPS